MPEQLKIRTFLVGASTYVIALNGTFDLIHVDDVRRELARARGNRAIVDVSGLASIDDAGVGVLAEASRQTELTVVADRRLRHRLAQFPSYGSLADAIADAAATV